MKKIFLSVIALTSLVLVSCSSGGAQKAVEAAAPVAKSQVVNDNILNRRSIRAFKPEQVGKDTVDAILKAGVNAPSANNKQPWEVRVVRKAETLAKIKATGANFYDAPTLLVIACDATNPFGMFDAGLFSQNVMLSAESFDLGTCALGSLAGKLNDGSAESQAVLAELAFSPDYKVVLAISLGYKNQSPEAKPRDLAKVKYID